MTAPAARTVLSFDYGLRRIGVAVGNTLTGTAEALETIAAADGAPDWRAVDRVVSAWRPAAIIAGVPYNMAGRDARLTTAALRLPFPAHFTLGLLHVVDGQLVHRGHEAVVDGQSALNVLLCALQVVCAVGVFLLVAALHL